MQGKCDSLSYSFLDSVIRLYDDPIVWSRGNQMTADSIALFTVNSKADHMEMFNKAFVVSEVDTARYDQISGKNLSGYFVDNKLNRIKVTGNGEAIYYVVDGDELVGVNRARSATIEIFFEDSKIVEIFQNQSPDGTMNPPLKIPDNEMRLEGYRWHPDLRPDRKSMRIDEILPPMPEMASDQVPEIAPADLPGALPEIGPEATPENAPQKGTELEPDNIPQKARSKANPIKSKMPEDIRDQDSAGI